MKILNNEEIKKIVKRNKEIIKQIDELDKKYVDNIKQICKLQADCVILKSKARKLRTGIRQVRFKFATRDQLTKEQKKEIIKEAGGKCEECGSDKNLTIHHKRKVSVGGTNHKNNLQVLCINCHGKKHPINEKAIFMGEIKKNEK